MVNKQFFILLFLLFGQPENKPEVRNYVPNEETAISIAEAVWLPIYGDKIYGKKPFVAELGNDSIWHVFGTLKPSGISTNSEGDTIITITMGGVPHIFINKSDGKILNVYHTK